MRVSEAGSPRRSTAGRAPRATRSARAHPLGVDLARQADGGRLLCGRVRRRRLALGLGRARRRRRRRGRGRRGRAREEGHAAEAPLLEECERGERRVGLLRALRGGQLERAREMRQEVGRGFKARERVVPHQRAAVGAAREQGLRHNAGRRGGVRPTRGAGARLGRARRRPTATGHHAGPGRARPRAPLRARPGPSPCARGGCPA